MCIRDRGIERITPVQFAQALKRGAETAYKAVMKPKEGTILTVARVIAEEVLLFELSCCLSWCYPDTSLFW